MNDKLKEYRDSLSDEDKAALIAKMHKARADKAAFRLENSATLKTDYLDSNHWATLASDMGIRMPSNLDPASSKVIRKYCKKANVSIEQFNEHYTSMSYFCENNPKWTAYAVAGLILEIANDTAIV